MTRGSESAVKERGVLSQAEKAARFAALHARAGAFVMANPWDAASARLLAGLGFEALGTSSSAAAAVAGLRDGQLTREEALAHARRIVEAGDLPVSADLESGYGAAPAAVAETIRLAAAAGLVGGSIEDATGDPRAPLLEIARAVERVEAAVAAAGALPFPFTITARAENFLHGRPDLNDTIERLRAYERAGADVLFAPGLPDLASVRAVCSGVSRPVSFMAGIRGRSFTVAELERAGVRRISLGDSLFRAAAISGLLDAAQEVRQRGTFSYLERG